VAPGFWSHLFAVAPLGVYPNLLVPGVGVSAIILIGVGYDHLPGVGVSLPMEVLGPLNLDGVVIPLPVCTCPLGVRSHLFLLGVVPSIMEGVLLGVSHLDDILVLSFMACLMSPTSCLSHSDGY
jgi:hypothetical protein